MYIMKGKRSGFPMDCYKYNKCITVRFIDTLQSNNIKTTAVVILLFLFFLLLFSMQEYCSHTSSLCVFNIFISYSEVDAFDSDLKKYPLLKKVSIVFEQLPGDILFIPGGWFHQASTLGPMYKIFSTSILAAEC